jgi:hypothetical protein
MDSFMEAFPHEGLTFDDVSLLTQYADFLPNDADIVSRLTRRISLNIPFVSAAMDTVTETKMAIDLAMLGGIGIIHKNLTASNRRKWSGPSTSPQWPDCQSDRLPRLRHASQGRANSQGKRIQLQRIPHFKR